MKGKYRKIYFLSFVLLSFVTIASIFVVFKKYRNEFSESKTLSGAKFELSKIKEKIGNLEEKMPVLDTTISEEYITLKLEEAFIDSLLNYNAISKESMLSIAEKLSNLTTKSEKLEKTIDELAVDSAPNTDAK